VLATGPLRRLAGGKGGNQAVAAALAGASVAMVGCVGDDDDGLSYLARLQRLGIDVSGVARCPGVTTGQAWVTVDAEGENAIVVVPGANDEVGVEPDHLAAVERLGPGDVLLVQLEVPMRAVAAAARTAHGRGARVVVNAAPYAALPHDVAALADPLVANEHEAGALADSDVTPTSLLVTFGAHGCSWDGQEHPAAAVDPAEVVDTTGAGDAFCGALAAALAAGAGRDEAVRRAAQSAADAVRRHGAQADPDL
jgi:ribokinase